MLEKYCKYLGTSLAIHWGPLIKSTFRPLLGLLRDFTLLREGSGEHSAGLVGWRRPILRRFHNFTLSIRLISVVSVVPAIRD